MENKNNILNELAAISPAIVNIGNENIFTVPNGYFNILPTIIKDRIYTTEILNKANTNPFVIPADYFDNLAINILSKIPKQPNEVEEITLLMNALNRQNLLPIPNGYFENFADTMMSKVKKLRKLN